MHEADLKSMKRKIDALWDALTPREQSKLLEAHDILATKTERQDPKATAKKISDFDQAVEHLGDMSLVVTNQMLATFEQNYDEDSVHALHGKEKEEYQHRLKQYNLLKKHRENIMRGD